MNVNLLLQHFNRLHSPLVSTLARQTLSILLLMFMTVTHVNGQSQEKRVTLNLNQVKIVELFNQIQQQTGLQFIYSVDDIKSLKNVSVSAVNKPVKQVLDELFSKDPIAFVYGVNSISVKPRSLGATMQATLVGSVKDSENKPIVGAAITIPGTTKGCSTDGKGNFTLNCTVDKTTVLRVTYMGMKPYSVVVGEQRSFNIVLTEDQSMISDIIVTGFQNIKKSSFTGASTKVQMDDIVQRGVTDVSRLLEGQVAGVTIQNVSSTFGTAPKLRVRGATSLSGDNKPLWVIDGVVHEDLVNISNDMLTSGDPATLLGSAVAGLNANDIESIDVLKDASATALYGARAMNGVVVVTTKRGKSGSKPVVSYSLNLTSQLVPSYSNYDIMNSADQMSIYAELARKGALNASIVNDANSGVYGKMYRLINTYDGSGFGLANTPEAREAFLSRYAHANTDWFGTLFRNSLQQEHSLSVSSGNDRSRTYVSLSVLNDNGWTIADHVRRYTANMRNDFNLGKNFKLAFQTVASIRDQEAPGSLNSRTNVVSGSVDRNFDINPFSYAMNTSRVLTPYDENGNLEYFTRNYAPFNIIDEVSKNKILLKVYDIKAQVDLGWRFAKNFNYEFTGAIRYVKSDREHRIHEKSNMAESYRASETSTIRNNNKYLYSDPDTPNAEPVVILPYGGFFNTNENAMNSMDIRNSIKYNAVFNKHAVNAIIGQQIKMADRQRTTSTGFGYQYDKGGMAFVDPKAIKQQVEASNQYYEMGSSRDRFAAFYANADYSYDNRYVASATVRYDGSNALGKNASARWLSTWNVSGKWNVSNEPFFEPLSKMVNYLAVRASYGLTASMPPSANSSIILENSGGDRQLIADKESTIVITSLANEDLTWEKGHLLNVGMDLSMFDRRLDVSVDVWRRQSYDLISRIVTPGIGGQISKRANYGDMNSSGVDFSVGGNIIQTRDFKWRANFTFGYNTSKITRSENDPRIIDMVRGNGGNIVGYPVNSLFSIQFAGLNPVNGIPMAIDEGGNISSLGLNLQSRDLGYLKFEGPVDPKYAGGFSNTFSYKGFALNVFFTYQVGNTIRLKPSFKSSYDDLDAMPAVFFDRWVLPGDEMYTNVPSIITREEYQPYKKYYPYSIYNYSDQRVAKGDFLRIKTISLSYTIPQSALRKIGIFSKVTGTVSGNNLFMIYADKRLNGQDPEFYNTGGVAQPLSKQITFTLNVAF